MELDYSKLKVADIKQMLLNEGRFTQEELDNLPVKGKSEWVSLHRGDEEIDWGDLVENEGELIMETHIVEPEKPNHPRYKDPGWHEYVMSQFSEDELLEGKYPNVNALRRVVELLLGDIIFSGPIETKTTLHTDRVSAAVVTYQIIIDWKLDAFERGEVGLEGYPQRQFLAVASAWEGNTDGIFTVFPEAMADTRAEVRALRRALRINTVGAEELTKKDIKAFLEEKKNSSTTTGEWQESDVITDQQINTIKVMCERLGINLVKFINSGSKQYADIGQITRSTAAGMIKELNRYQSCGDGSIEIPQNIIGD